MSLRVVGNPCHDTLIRADGTRVDTLGGSASYVSAVLDALGAPFDIVSKVGRDFRYASGLPRAPRVVQAPTTHFIADFRSGERVLTLTAACEAIEPADIEGWAEVSLAVAIAGEVPSETLARLAERSRHVLCDVQGLIRGIGDDGRVFHRRLEQTPYRELLGRVSMIKASREEAEFLDLGSARQLTTVVVTDGPRGCTVYERDREFQVEAFPVTEIDPTGAGDCFLAGYAWALLRGEPSDKCAKFANYCGARAVAQVGVPRDLLGFAAIAAECAKLPS